MVGVLESTDRVQHMFWRFIDPTHPMYDAAGAAKYGDSIERVYKRCDQLVGEVLQRIEPGTLVFVLSDHGFHSFKYGVNLNTWLVENGFIARQGRAIGDKNLNDMFGGGGQFWEGVDWTRTRAYSLGLGQVYFNVRGREGQGIVNEGDEYRRLADELSAKLLTMTDPKTGQRIVRSVYKRDDVYSGPFMANAPDLQVGLRGRVSRVLADLARRLAAGSALPEHEEVERRPLLVRLPDDSGLADLQPQALRGPGQHCRHRADGAEVLRRGHPEGDRREAAVLKKTEERR